MRFPDIPLIIPCSDLGQIDDLVQQNAWFRERECRFAGQEFANSLYFSLLAGNSPGERLAPDCPLRHAVCSAEKSAQLSLHNREKSPPIRDFRPQPALEKIEIPTPISRKSYLFL